jgi:hypothetical protein
MFLRHKLNRPKAILESLAMCLYLYGIISDVETKVERSKSTGA